jgi:predicted nucleic acid-binding protein
VMSLHPSDAVRRWFARRERVELYTTAVSEGEIFAGLECMPPGRKRNELERGAERILERVVGGRVLPFDRQAAHLYALVFAERRRIGRPIKSLDAQIVAIARAHDATLATRNVGDFSGCGVEVVNPWEPLLPG